MLVPLGPQHDSGPMVAYRSLLLADIIIIIFAVILSAGTNWKSRCHKNVES
jgi:hypothetical protein